MVVIYLLANGPTLQVSEAVPSRGGGYVVNPASGPITVTPAAPSPPGVTGLGKATGSVRLVLPSKQEIASVLVSQHNADLRRLLLISWVVLAITAVASGLLGWLGAGRVLRPLRSMSEKARTISAGNLEERLALAGPDDEFKLLGDTFDELLARLEAAFEAQRRFVANASHELRTPLTLDRALLQLALSDPAANPARSGRRVRSCSPPTATRSGCSRRC